MPYNDNGWIVREIAAPEAYVLSDKAFPEVITKQAAVVEITMENTLIRGSVHTTKVDLEYPDNKLTGALFDVYLDINKNGVYDEGVDTYVGSLTETGKGQYQLDDLLYSGYFLHEKQAPAGFVLDPGYYFFKIEKDGEVVTVENKAGIGFTNKPITGELWLTKKDVSDGKLIPNCGIRIKDKDGNIVFEDRTDKDGFVKFKLRAGLYTYSEFDCKGYQLDESEYPFEINEDGQIIRAMMTNEKIPENPGNPKTGDERNMALWLILMGVSAAALVGVTVMGKRRKLKESK